jgi:hypothetical protein
MDSTLKEARGDRNEDYPETQPLFSTHCQKEHTPWNNKGVPHHCFWSARKSPQKNRTRLTIPAAPWVLWHTAGEFSRGEAVIDKG